MRRHRARHRRAAVGGLVVWLGEVILAGVGFAAMILAGAFTALVLFVGVLFVVSWWLVRHQGP